MPFRKQLLVDFTTARGVQEALELGVTSAQLRNPELHAPFRGVRVTGELRHVHEFAESYRSLLPMDGAFSHSTAARLHGMPLPWRESGLPVHVTIPRPGRARQGRGVIGHSRQLSAHEIIISRGLPLTSVERTWCDLAAMLTLPELVAAADHLLWFRAPKTTPAALQAAVEAFRGRRGLPALRAALPLLSDRSQSSPETMLRLSIQFSHFPPVRANFEYRLSTGRVVFLDLAFEVFQVGLEYEGDHHRTDVEQWRSDVRRIEDLTAEGWRMMRVTATDVRDMPLLISRIEARLRQAGWDG